MSLLNSGRNSKQPQPATSTRRRFGIFKGWIDLERDHRRLIPVITLLILSAAAFGTHNYLKNVSKSEVSEPGALESTFPPANPSVTSETHFLSKEYLYAGSDLIAVEDGGATSAPTSDLAIWRPSTGTWWIKAGSQSSQVSVQWGVATDRPVIGDYDGDGKTDFCVFRPSEGRWYLIRSGTNDGSTSTLVFGRKGDIPAPADFDGDGKTDYAVWRPSEGVWHIRRSSNGSTSQVRFGLRGDDPIPADFDGDGKVDLAIWRPDAKTFYSINSSDGKQVVTNMGSPGVPVPGDYDGDGSDDFAVRNGSIWSILKSSEGRITRTSWQSGSDIAVHNDYDGDGVTDLATWRPSGGLWLISQSSDGRTRSERWGTDGDIPLPALYKR